MTDQGGIILLGGRGASRGILERPNGVSLGRGGVSLSVTDPKRPRGKASEGAEGLRSVLSGLQKALNAPATLSRKRAFLVLVYAG